MHRPTPQSPSLLLYLAYFGQAEEKKLFVNGQAKQNFFAVVVKMIKCVCGLDGMGKNGVCGRAK